MEIAMDPDSFLNLLSPDFDDLDIAWGSPVSDSDLFSVQPPSLAWLNDGYTNPICAEEEDEEDEDEDDEDDEEEECGEAFSHSKKTAKSCSSALSTSIVSNASDYSSVLKLSDIASALRSFSKSGTGGTDARFKERRAAPQHRLFPAHSVSSGSPHSSCLPNSSTMAAIHTPVQNVFAVTKEDSPNLCEMHLGHSPAAVMTTRDASAEKCLPPGDPVAADMILTGFRHEMQSGEMDANMTQGSDSAGASDKELSSKLTCTGNKGWESSDNTNEDEDDDDDDNFVDYEEKPCVSHVKIIRRPNSNCGQGPSPKRPKVAHNKAKATSSSETTSFQDDKDGVSSLKQMRKEGMSQREVHILSERQRRKSMRESFSILQALVPKLKLKHTDRITVLTEVINYVQSLRGTLEGLERKKADIMELLGLSTKPKSRRHRRDDFQGTITYINSNNSGSSDEKADRPGGPSNNSSQNGETVATVEVTVRMCAADVFITLNMTRRRGVWSRVLGLLEKLSIEVSNATLTTCGDSSFHCIHAKATNIASVEGVDLQEELEAVIVKELKKRSRKGPLPL